MVNSYTRSKGYETWNFNLNNKEKVGIACPLPLLICIYYFTLVENATETETIAPVKQGLLISSILIGKFSSYYQSESF